MLTVAIVVVLASAVNGFAAYWIISSWLKPAKSEPVKSILSATTDAILFCSGDGRIYRRKHNIYTYS